MFSIGKLCLLCPLPCVLNSFLCLCLICFIYFVFVSFFFVLASPMSLLTTTTNLIRVTLHTVPVNVWRHFKPDNSYESCGEDGQWLTYNLNLWITHRLKHRNRRVLRFFSSTDLQLSTILVVRQFASFTLSTEINHILSACFWRTVKGILIYCLELFMRKSCTQALYLSQTRLLCCSRKSRQSLPVAVGDWYLVSELLSSNQDKPNDALSELQPSNSIASQPSHKNAERSVSPKQVLGLMFNSDPYFDRV